jgi:class 3 adenylate cyclase
VTRETFSLIMEALSMEGPAVQKALRSLLPKLCQGSFAEELRQILLESLTVRPLGAGSGTSTPAAPTPHEVPSESLLHQAKLEFKFKRENTQVLTVFFIDIAGYTEKSTTIDMSSLLALIKAFEEIVGTCVAQNRGAIVKKMGDGILAVFKHPLHAVLAAFAIQQKISRYNEMRVEQEKFQTRIGLHTGAVIRKDGDVFGEVVNVASRMQSAATPGDILLTESTFEEIRDYVRCTELGRIQVKGIKEAITAYSPEELTVDLAKLQNPAGDQKKGKSIAGTSMEKLKESIFTPDFRIPPEKSGKSPMAGFLGSLFSEISRAAEDITADYHEEYVFKRFLQDKWNELLTQL